MKIIVTGGAGFIGSNAAAKWIAAGHRVVIVDNLSRPGADANLAWLETRGAFELQRVDIRDEPALSRAFERHRDATAVVHLAAQVAVTTSVTDPRGLRGECARNSDVVRQHVLAKVQAPLLDRVLDLAQTIIATSPNYVDSSTVLRRFAHKCSVVPYGVDLELYRPTPERSAEAEAIRARYGGRPSLD